MRRNCIILGPLALLALLAAPAPAALAGGPLLSGYGGPGAGAQAIIGGTLLNGPRGGSGGGSGGSAGGSASFGAAASLSSSSATSASHLAAGGRDGQDASRAFGGPGAGRSRRHGSGRGAGDGGASPGSTGAHSSSSHLGVASMAASVSAGASWFTGGDLLALVLAAGVLALVTAATVRLSGIGAHHE